MPVRISSRGAPLQSVNLQIIYDDSILAIEGCRREVAEKHPFGCNYEAVAGDVRLAELCPW